MIVAILGIIFVIAAAAIVLWIVISKTKKKNLTRCKKCKTKYDVDSDVQWTKLKDISTSKGRETQVEFTCTCPNCNEVRTFIRNFPLQTLTANDKVINHNVDGEIREYFKN